MKSFSSPVERKEGEKKEEERKEGGREGGKREEGGRKKEGERKEGGKKETRREGGRQLNIVTLIYNKFLVVDPKWWYSENLIVYSDSAD